MVQVTSGLRGILSHPATYRFVQRIFGGAATLRDFVDRFVRPQAGDRILDIGCGPAQILNCMNDIRYVGYDPSESYISDARKIHDPALAQFFAGRFRQRDLALHQPFDIGLLLGVLHHLDDEEATALVGLMRSAIRTGGRLITLDNVFIDHQNPIARKLIEWDRGKNVRTASKYRALTDKHFDLINDTIVHKTFPPYTLYISECS
jgi:SAM-dependent methyltransferase